MLLQPQFKVLSLAVVVPAAVAVFGFFSLSASTRTFEYQATAAIKQAGGSASTTTSPVRHLPTPPAVKAIYMSQCVAGTPSFRQRLVELIETTELNAVVIDIKDYTGKISFPTDQPALREFVSSQCLALDMKEFVQTLHDRGVYVIGRITVFQDPAYSRAYPELAVKKQSDPTAVWHDRKGLSFIDVGARPFWSYIVALAKESYALGFDEINFDYIRFPSDGNMEDIYFPWSVGRGETKPEALEKFFQYLHAELQPIGMVTSADLFGMTTTNTDDLNIGQVLERSLAYFDYIAPMVYPSHYPPHFNGWNNPNQHIYDLIHYTLSGGVARVTASTTMVQAFSHTRLGTTTPAIYTKPVYPANKIRPWLQDFDYGGNYDVDEVKAQIKATYDAGLNSWMIWDPSNKYTRNAYEME